MIKRNLIVGIYSKEHNVDELILEVKSNNDRSMVILETFMPKLAVKIEELKEAINIVEKFSLDNPALVVNSTIPEENVFQVEMGIDVQ